jgi:hypothetical protein
MYFFIIYRVEKIKMIGFAHAGYVGVYVLI